MADRNQSPNPPEDKPCIKCGLVKPLAEFPRSSTCISGYRNECTKCSNARVAKWKREHRTHKPRQKKPKRPYDPARERRKVLNHKYRITDRDYERLLEKQGGVCAVCQTVGRANINSFRLSVDHCHNTKRVRGLLCSACNTAIGMLGDSIEGLQRAIDYLKRPTEEFPVTAKAADRD